MWSQKLKIYSRSKNLNILRRENFFLNQKFQTKEWVENEKLAKNLNFKIKKIHKNIK
jgi:hypothetical protein